MPLSPLRAPTKSATCFFQLLFSSTERVRLGRSNPVATETMSPLKMRSSMSARVVGSAVAVRPMIGTPGKRSRKPERAAYSGRNAGPHWEMQCASSMANRLTPMAESARSMGSVISRSGDR